MYLQPTIASEYEASRNVYLVTFGALLWDMLSSLRKDWRLIRTCKRTPALFAYFSARSFAFAVVLISVSSYHFPKRVHAIFLPNRIIRHLLTFLWLCGVGASMVVLPLDDYHEIANTRHCADCKTKNYVSAAFIVPVLFDALPFCPSTRSVLQLSASVPAAALTSAMVCRVFRNLQAESLQEAEVGTPEDDAIHRQRASECPAAQERGWCVVDADLEQGVTAAA
ncbi:hypothetical protein PAXRUDRAFT_35511 [Paxillus rubicundulus Ve08.2h10]|uniref:Uncharacterized protein n=1 Tax=Paxillus rubicundulus Ve08.2h10 TaxID=930991 RepID=A0A0D0CJR0_9AGAM|nr:hypothetical protein PAXRUDRAFT_35511 [Paxillus rubicundulus Ve08.2h10]